jgi:hypothetical protein
MLKFIYTAAAGVLLLTASTSDVQAKMSRAISTDSSTPLQAVVGTPNAEAMTMFILANPNPNGDNNYVSLYSLVTNSVVGDPVFCNKSFAISGSQNCTASTPGVPVSLGLTGPNGELPIGEPLASDPPDVSPSPRLDFGQVQFAITNFTESQTYLSGSLGNGVPDLTPGFVFGGSGFFQMDMVTTDFSDFGLGVLDPAIASFLAGLPAGSNLQFIGWQDYNASDGSTFDPNDENSVDPWTYDNMIMAVWFAPNATVPEPASLLLFAPVLLGASYIVRRRRGFARAR